MSPYKSIIEGSLPQSAWEIVDRLESFGHEAYAVGGAVRDAILSKKCSDVDICTSALPDEVTEIFKDRTVVPTGIKHGTVTVVCDGVPYEVTTFRSESGYSDRRRPDSVTFVSDIAEDLVRRDFTVNAMAYSPKRGFIDLYGGLSDLENGILRAVGDPEKRFEEDPLRILRAARFISKLGFKTEEKTFASAVAMKDLLGGVSAERIFSELLGTLCGKYAADTLMTYAQIIFTVVPELAPCYRFDQHSKWHKYDVYEHIARSVGAIEPDGALRFAMFLHDAGKPECFFTRDGEGHFYGHAKVSAEIAAKVLKRLRSPAAFREDVVFYVLRHDEPFSDGDVPIKRKLRKYGEERVLNLFRIKEADHAAQGTALAASEAGAIGSLRERTLAIIARGDCYSLSSLKINGADAVREGYSGGSVGAVLNAILDDVIVGNVANDREAQLKSLRRRKVK